MILLDHLGKGKQVNNVLILGEVSRYVEDGFGFQHNGNLHFFELKVHAVKFLGEIYDPENTGVDNISITDGFVYCATSNPSLEGSLVTVKNKTRGCNLKLSWMQNTKEKYINAFNFYKDAGTGSWVVAENFVEVYTPSQSGTFAELHKVYLTNGGIPDNEETKAYKQYQPNLDTIFREEVREAELDSKVVLDIAKKKLEEVYSEVSNIFNYQNYENIWSYNEIANALLRVVTPNFVEKNGFQDLSDDIDKIENTVGTYLSACCGYSGDPLNKVVNSYFKKNGLTTLCSLQVFLMRPYLFSFMFKGLSLKQCDKLVSVLVKMGYPVSADGRRAMLAFQNYRSQNDTLVTAVTLKGFAKDTDFSQSKWVLAEPISLEDNINYEDFFEKVGSGSKIYGYISWDNLYKEAFIIHHMSQMAEENSKEVPQSKINEVVSSLPFKLEPKQLEAVQHCESGVVIIPGCAGSGKTTISKCISDIIGGQVGYAAPTGKAARRLSESVNMPVRTIHSMFKLGIGTPGFLSPLESQGDYGTDFPPTLIIDEAAMINLDVMFQVVKKLHKLPIKLIMMGDPNQLQPIGNGAIFRDLMTVFDPVQLEVSKRFAGGSGVGFNCKVIVEGGYNLEPREDFIFKSADVSDIKKFCISNFMKGVEKFGIDNVQIATPYVKADKPWGSTQLNALAQELLFEDKEDLFLCNFRDFKVYKGTKVVQGSPNLPGKPHYEWDKKTNTFSSKDSVIGVFNGDVGYVEDMIPANFVQIDNSKAISEFDDVTTEEIEDYFLVVRLDDDDYVLYSAKQFKDRVIGEELNSLDLAYALTVHKLQGSEYQYIIFPLSNSDSVNFVSNEMVYTALSRAKKYVTVVGSQSKVSQCLRTRKSPYIKTMMSRLK